MSKQATTLPAQEGRTEPAEQVNSMDIDNQQPEPAEEVLYKVYYYCSHASGDVQHDSQLLDHIRKVTEGYLMELERKKKQAERARCEKC